MPLKLLVISDPKARHLSVLETLPPSAQVTIGNSPEELQPAIADADVILNGMNNGQTLRKIWSGAKKVRWVHSLSAGIENTVFPELIESPVPLTNARGVFKRSLGEFAVTAMLFFAKDLRRMLRSQAEGKWDPFDVEELAGRTLGIIGYGEIGRSAAERAKPFGMKIAALRRRAERSNDDPLVDQAYPLDKKIELIQHSDYILTAAPLTQETRGMIGEPEIRAMKSSAVIINLGRGPVINEAALVAALQERRIRGAALDVFDQEPLPADHPLWKLDNVLLSPHCADHTSDWLEQAVGFFVSNFNRFDKGEELENVVDKRAGY